MTLAERGAAESAQRIADALEEAGLPYAIGGALALALERLVAVRSELDHGYVRRWIVDMMGEDDERVRRWDDIVRRFAARK